MGSPACQAWPLGGLALLVSVTAAAATEAVDIELVLAVDMSISVDASDAPGTSSPP